MPRISRSYFNNERLEENIKIFKEIVSCLEEIIEQSKNSNGKSMSTICLEHGLNYLNLRRLMLLKNFQDIMTNNVNVIEPEDIEIYDPYETLYRIIFRINKEEVVNLPIDLEDTIYTVMKEALTEREFNIVFERYGFGNEEPRTLESIGKQMNLSGNRVNEIEHKALRKLRAPKNAKRIMYGLIKWNELEEQRKLKIMKEKKIVKERMEEYKKSIEEKVVNGEDVFPIILQESSEMDISELEFCRRSYNSLKRAGITTMHDLLFMTNNSLMKLRNFGIESLREVEKKIENYLERYYITRADFFTHFGIE